MFAKTDKVVFVLKGMKIIVGASSSPEHAKKIIKRNSNKLNRKLIKKCVCLFSQILEGLPSSTGFKLSLYYFALHFNMAS